MASPCPRAARGAGSASGPDPPRIPRRGFTCLHMSHFGLLGVPRGHGAEVPVPELQAHGGIELRPFRGSVPRHHRPPVGQGPAPVRSDLEGARGSQRQGDDAAVALPPVRSEFAQAGSGRGPSAEARTCPERAAHHPRASRQTYLAARTAPVLPQLGLC